MNERFLEENAKRLILNAPDVQAVLNRHKTSIRIIEKQSASTAEQADLPYSVGQFLYVAETFANTWTPCGDTGYVYKADGEPAKFPYWGKDDGIGTVENVWRPSTSMPKEAARLFLRVKDIWRENLQDITEEQAMNEGVDPFDDACYENNGWTPTLIDPDSGGSPIFRDGFRALWDSSIKEEDLLKHGWEANPEVVVIEFEKFEF